MILMTYVGNFTISEDQAKKLAVSTSDMFTVENNIISRSQIKAIVSEQQYDDILQEKSGKYKCSKGNWHGKFDMCKCGWGETSLSQKAKNDKILEAQTPHSKEKSKLIKQLLDKGWRLRDLIKLKGKTNEEIKEILKNIK